MTAIAFDTLKAATRLKAAGFDEKQAYELVSTFAESVGENIATRDDLALMKGDIKAEIDLLRKDTKAEIDLLRKDMVSGDETLRQNMVSGFASLRQDMVSGDNALRRDMIAGFQNLEQGMTIKLGSLIVAAVGFLAVLDRLFPA